LGSVAVAVNVIALPGAPDLGPIAPRTGAWLAAVTVMVTVSESLSGGVPLSATTTVAVKVPAEAGVQLKAPVELLIVAPAGAPVSEKVRV
jgi:hypothetical protein